MRVSPHHRSWFHCRARRVKAPLRAGSAPLSLGQMLAGKGKNKSLAAARAWLRDSKCAGQTRGMGLRLGGGSSEGGSGKGSASAACGGSTRAAAGTWWGHFSGKHARLQPEVVISLLEGGKIIIKKAVVVLLRPRQVCLRYFPTSLLLVSAG